MLAPEEFWTWWQAEFGECPPIGHQLREQLGAGRWLRFHSLPGGKRYATEAAERAEIMHRHDAVATALFGHGAPIAIVRAAYATTEAPVAPDDAHGAVPADELAFLGSLRIANPYDPDLPPSYWHGWLASARWAANRFHALFTAIADDELDDVVLVSVERRAVFAPYDGGIDVIAADRFVADALGREFRAWRPTTPSGL